MKKYNALINTMNKILKILIVHKLIYKCIAIQFDTTVRF